MATVVPYAGGNLDLTSLFSDAGGAPLTGTKYQNALNTLTTFQTNLEQGKAASIDLPNGVTYSYSPTYGPVSDFNFGVRGQDFSNAQGL
ncbi:MAG: hypothetical protein EBU08_06010, partial [Micrococcales bacterium]|nr:hypothetical protein [Micrococcales bacterium]